MNAWAPARSAFTARDPVELSGQGLKLAKQFR